MKMRRKNCYTLLDIVRFGAVILIFLDGLAVTTEAVKTSRDYSHLSKPRSKPREIRGFRTRNLSTAIGFGKRQSDFQSLYPNTPDSQMPFSRVYIPERFPIEWFIHLLKTKPELAHKIERELLSGFDNSRSSTVHRFKKANNNMKMLFE